LVYLKNVTVTLQRAKNNVRHKYVEYSFPRLALSGKIFVICYIFVVISRVLGHTTYNIILIAHTRHCQV